MRAIFGTVGEQVQPEVAEAAFDLLCAVQRLVSVVDAWDAFGTALLVLALKTGASAPEEVAARCGLSGSCVRQRLRRLAGQPVERRLVERRARGSYALTLRGHRRANELAGLAHFGVLRSLSRSA